MLLTQIVSLVNQKLAGEILTYDELKVHLDSVIDDINGALDATFPAFTDFTSAAYSTVYPNYNFFPDRFVRSVVVQGAATKFYITDEEGIETAQQYLLDYQQALFVMQRDYSNSIPTEFQAGYQGYLRSTSDDAVTDESAYFPDIRYVEYPNVTNINFGNLYADVEVLKVHNHAALYAALSHNHTGVYSALGHDHDADYAAVGHDHSGTYADASTKVKFTTEGGLAIKLTNKTGSASVKGTVVASSTGTNNAFMLQANELDSIGVVYDAGVADGAECWVVVSGVAEVLLKDQTAATRGNWVVAATDDGRADATQPTPTPNNTLNEHTTHFKEIGHCIESKTAGAAGELVLAKIVLHFN